MVPGLDGSNSFFYQCRIFSFQASNASSLREEEEEFFSMKLKNFWLIQSCLSKLNTIALGVGSQFSSVKLRESKEEQQQAARTDVYARPDGFSRVFFSLFFTNSCISWCETLRAILFFTLLLWCHHSPFSKVVVLTILQKRLTRKWALKVCAPLCADPEEALHTIGWKTLWRSLISKKLIFHQIFDSFHRMYNSAKIEDNFETQTNNTKLFQRLS